MIHAQQPFVPTVTISIQDYEMMYKYQTAILESRVIVYASGNSYLAEETELVAELKKEIASLQKEIQNIRRDIEVHGVYRKEYAFREDDVYKCTIKKRFFK